MNWARRVVPIYTAVNRRPQIAVVRAGVRYLIFIPEFRIREDSVYLQVDIIHIIHCRDAPLSLGYFVLVCVHISIIYTVRNIPRC